MGIISSIQVKHEQEVGGRTETASMNDKWKGVQKQERFYRRYKNIDLKSYRENSRLKNSSWNGAVLGYIYE